MPSLTLFCFLTLFFTDELIKEYVKNHQDKDFGDFTVG